LTNGIIPPMRISIVLLLCFVIFSSSQWIVEHSFDNGISWTQKGSIEKIGKTERLNFIPLNKFWSEENFSKLVNNNLYQIRIKTKNQHIQSTTSTCDLLNSNLKEELSLFFDNEENLISLNQHFENLNSLNAPCDQLKQKKFEKMKENLTVKKNKPELFKELVTVKPSESTTEDEKKKGELEPGFFRKYV
jgi:hypothetical protein